MALNIRPLWGANYPFMHPEMTVPEEKEPLRSFTQNHPEREHKDKLFEAKMDRDVKWMRENAQKLRFKKLDLI